MKHNWRYIAGIGISRAPIHIHEPRRFPRVIIRRNDYYGGKAKEERRACVVHPIRPGTTRNCVPFPLSSAPLPARLHLMTTAFVAQMRVNVANIETFFRHGTLSYSSDFSRRGIGMKKYDFRSLNSRKSSATDISFPLAIPLILYYFRLLTSSVRFDQRKSRRLRSQKTRLRSEI